MDTLTRKQFGVALDPYKGLMVRTADAARIEELVHAAVQHRTIVSIAGPRGSGKTRAAAMVLKGGLRPAVVEPLRLDREKLHLGDIQSAIVRELSDERPRTSGEARSGQVRRVLRAASRHGPVALWIDDAHVLHPSTVRGLKRLTEFRGADGEGLLAVILTGQSDGTAGVPEVALRSDRMTCAGLTADEARAAIERALGELVAPAESAALAASPRARNWLDLAALVDECLQQAAARGEDRVTGASVAAALGAAPDAERASEEEVAAYLERRAA